MIELSKFPGGATYVVAKDGDTLCSVTGTVLEIWDVRPGNIPSPEFIHWAGTDEIIPRLIQRVEFNVVIAGLVMSGDKIIIGHEGGITIFSKTTFAVLGKYVGENVARMKIQGNFLYATSTEYEGYDFPRRFMKFDISGPNPVLVAKWDIPASRDANLQRFALYGNYAYCGFVFNTLTGGVVVVDTTTMTPGVQLLSVRDGVSGVYVDPVRKILYALTYRNTLYTFDLTNPANPVQLGSLTGLVMMADITAIDANTIVGSEFYYGIGIIDVTDPAFPRFVKELQGSPRIGYVSDVMVNGDYTYVANMGGGFSIFNHKTSKFVNQTLTHGVFYDVRIQGNYAYVTADFEILVLDITNIYDIKYKGSVEWARSGIGAVIGNTVYIDEGWRSLALVDVSNPSAPIITKKYSDHTKVGFVDSSRQEIGIGQNSASPPNAKVQIIDYAANLKRELTISTTHTYPPIVNKIGQYLYCSIQAEGVVIVRDDGTTLTVVGRFGPKDATGAGERFTRMKVNGNYLYGLGDYYLFTYDITNPLAPVLIGRLRHPTTPPLHFGGVYGIGRLEMVGNRLYNGCKEGLVYWDLTNPAAPGTAVLEIPEGDTGGFDQVGDLLLSAVGYKGVYAYAPSGQPPPPPPPVSTGNINFTSTPPGATVYLGNNPIPNVVTPFTLKDVIVGIYEARFVLAGYNDVRISVEVLPNQTVTATANFAVKEYGSISFETDPPGADVYYDLVRHVPGMLTPFTLNNIPVGTHQIKFTKTGYVNAIVSVDVKLNETVVARATLVPIAPPPKYSCSGAPDYQCVQDPNGKFNSLADCRAACVAPARYRCSGYPDYQCIQDPAGNFGSLAECQAVCKLTTPPPGINVVGVVVTLAGLGAIAYSLKRVASSRP